MLPPTAARCLHRGSYHSVLLPPSLTEVRAMCKLLAVPLLGFAALTTLAGTPLNADDKTAAKDAHHAAYMECAKACGECALACDSCASHCAKLVADGKREHLKTLQTCQDCAAFCGTAACITAKAGPFSDLICTSCADACKRCGDECDKYKSDQVMKECADECRKCEKACRDMLKHVAQAK